MRVFALAPLGATVMLLTACADRGHSPEAALPPDPKVVVQPVDYGGRTQAREARNSGLCPYAVFYPDDGWKYEEPTIKRRVSCATAKRVMVALAAVMHGRGECYPGFCPDDGEHVQAAGFRCFGLEEDIEGATVDIACRRGRQLLTVVSVGTT